VFRNVGIKNSEAGEFPRRKHKTELRLLPEETRRDRASSQPGKSMYRSSFETPTFPMQVRIIARTSVWAFQCTSYFVWK